MSKSNDPETLRSTAVAFHQTDAAWQSALEASFGRRAGDARYTLQGRGRPGSALRSLYVSRYQAYAAWCEARGIAPIGDPVASGVTVMPAPAMVPQPCQQQQANAGRASQDEGCVSCRPAELLSDEAYRRAASSSLIAGDGVEIDADAVVSRSESGGAYVAAWVWVSDDEVRA